VTRRSGASGPLASPLVSAPPGDDASRPAGSPRRSHRWRRLAWLGLAVAAVVGLRAALPWVVARGAERWAAEALGTPVEIAGVDLALLRGVVGVRGVVAGPRPAPDEPVARDTAFVAVRRLEVHLDWGPLFRERRIALHELEVDSPALRLERRRDGSVALRGVGAGAGSGAPEDPADAGAEVAGGEGGTDAQEGTDPTAVSVDRIRIVDGVLHLVEASDRTPLLELALDALELQELVVGGEPLRLASLAIEEPSLRVERALLGPPPGAPDDETPPAEEPPRAEDAPTPEPGYRIERIVVDRGSVVLGGGQEAAPLELGLEVEATGLGAAPGQRFPLAVRVEAGGGSLRLEGDASLAPPGFEGSLDWRELPLLPLLRAGAPELAAWLRTGRSSGELRVDGRLGAQPEASAGAAQRPGLRAEGRVALADLDLQDPAGSGLGVGGRELALRIGDGRVLLGGAPGDGGRAELRAATLDLEGSDLRFSDLRVAPAYRLRLASLEAGARDLVWPGPTAQELRLEARGDRGTVLRLEGDLADEVGWVEAHLDDLGLPPLTPYAEPALGLRFTSGTLAIEGRAALETDRTQVQSTWWIGDLGLGAGDPGVFERTVGVSRGMALALLRGPGGGIRLPVSFAVERGELVADTGAVVRGAVRQALVGVLTTPLKALGAVLPTGAGVEPARTVAAPLPAERGAVRLADEGEKRLEALAKLLAEHPDLAAVLRGRTAPGELESPTTADAGDAAEGEAAAPADARDGEAEPGEQVEPEEDEDAVAPALRTPLALAQARAIRARNRLFDDHGVAIERVAVASPTPEGDPGVVVELIPLLAR